MGKNHPIDKEKAFECVDLAKEMLAAAPKPVDKMTEGQRYVMMIAAAGLVNGVFISKRGDDTKEQVFSDSRLTFWLVLSKCFDIMPDEADGIYNEIMSSCLAGDENRGDENDNAVSSVLHAGLEAYLRKKRGNERGYRRMIDTIMDAILAED